MQGRLHRIPYRWHPLLVPRIADTLYCIPLQYFYLFTSRKFVGRNNNHAFLSR